MSTSYQRSSDITFVQWEQDTVIYNHGSACTHIISIIPAELLSLMFSEQKSFSESALLVLTEKAYPQNSSEQNNSYLQELKRQLISKELIETI